MRPGSAGRRRPTGRGTQCALFTADTDTDALMRGSNVAGRQPRQFLAAKARDRVPADSGVT